MSQDVPSVLLLTHSADHFTVDRVAQAIESLGARATRFDTDRFPSELHLCIERDGREARHGFTLAGEQYDLADYDAVWCRRLWEAKLPADLDERFREGCVRESRAALHGFLDGLSHARWLNSREADQRANDKLLQLEWASNCGLRIPRSLLTNDPGRVRDFCEDAEGGVITKMLTPLSVSMGKPSFFVRTSPVAPEDLEALEGLACCPMLFQEDVAKDVELRVVFVSGECFVGGIDASGTKSGTTDWRGAEVNEVAWAREEIPVEVADALGLLMARLELDYGAIDLIRTPDGEHVFLEVNPRGEWGMLEQELSLDISGAIARSLLTNP